MEDIDATKVIEAFVDEFNPCPCTFGGGGIITRVVREYADEKGNKEIRYVFYDCDAGKEDCSLLAAFQGPTEENIHKYPGGIEQVIQKVELLVYEKGEAYLSHSGFLDQHLESIDEVIATEKVGDKFYHLKKQK